MTDIPFPSTIPAPTPPPSLSDDDIDALFRQPPPAGPPMVAPPLYEGSVASDNRRWGMGDIVLGAVLALVLAGIGNVAPIPFLSSEERAALTSGDTSAVPLIVVLTGLFGLQLGQGVWPVIVARWKGNGVVRDFGLHFRWSDLGWGVLGLIILLPLAGIMNLVVSWLVGLEPGSEESSNTGLLTDNTDSPLVWLVVAFVVLGAPLVEELFFRGLCLRAIEKRAGTVVAVLGSTVLFVLPHYTGSSWQGTVVLFAVIGTVGLILALLTVRFDRLGPAMIMHALFNSFGVLAAFFPESFEQALGFIV